MKVTLDLSKLLEQGKITQADAERLKSLALQDTGNLGLNILTGFGVIAASAGGLALLLTAFDFTPFSAMLIGACAFALGLLLLWPKGEVWGFLSQTLIVLGFVAVHTERRRGEKPATHPGASLPGVECGVPATAPPTAGRARPPARRRGPPLPPTAERAGDPIPQEAAA